MSMSVNLHTKNNEVFAAKAKLTSNGYGTNDEKYIVIHVESRQGGENTYGNYQEVSIFPSFEQAKQIHKELSKLMKEMAALEKRTKAEIHAKNLTNSKAQKFSQMVEYSPYGILTDFES
jgi:hypothetical protein